MCSRKQGERVGGSAFDGSLIFSVYFYGGGRRAALDLLIVVKASV